jgi:hypothetical protein
MKIGLRRSLARSLLFFAVFLGYFLPRHVIAADIWVVRVLTGHPDPVAPPGSISVAWRDHLIFRNTTAHDLTVMGVTASNGYQMPPGENLVVPAGKTRSVFIFPTGTSGLENRWVPLMMPPVMLVNRLSVPPGIIVESRVEPFGCGELIPCGFVPPGSIGTDILGSVALPVISTLFTANTPQYHLAADLGTQTSITNVGIYNSEDTPASATIELVAACNESVLQSRSTSVPANTLVYVTGFRSAYLDTGCGPETPLAAQYLRHVIVRMDRAGFSFIATRAESHDPRITVSSTTPR